MRRSIALLVALAGLIGVVGSAAADGGPGDLGVAPEKTVAPTVPFGAPAAAPPSTVPPLGGAPALPTAAPPTSAWLATTAPPPPPVAPTVASAPPTVPAVPTADPNAVTSSTVATAAQFDGLAFLTEVYAAVNDDPLDLLDIAESDVVINSPADLFLAHLVTVAMTNRFYSALAEPIYTVAVAGKGVSVCTDAGACNTFGDFVAPTGLLESFTINGVAIEDAVSGSTRRVVAESLSVDSVVCLQGTDGTLSCAALLTTEGASVALSFDRAVFTGNDGQQFAPDLAVSVFARSITDGDFGSAHLVFRGAPLEGMLAIPVVSGLSGVETTVTVPINVL